MRRPAHYEKSPEPWDVIDAWNLDFFLGNVVKYVARWEDKGGVEDLEKAQRYLEEKIKRIKNGQSTATGSGG